MKRIIGYVSEASSGKMKILDRIRRSQRRSKVEKMKKEREKEKRETRERERQKQEKEKEKKKKSDGM